MTRERRKPRQSIPRWRKVRRICIQSGKRMLLPSLMALLLHSEEMTPKSRDFTLVITLRAWIIREKNVPKETTVTAWLKDTSVRSTASVPMTVAFVSLDADAAESVTRKPVLVMPLLVNVTPTSVFLVEPETFLNQRSVQTLIFRGCTRNISWWLLLL